MPRLSFLFPSSSTRETPHIMLKRLIFAFAFLLMVQRVAAQVPPQAVVVSGTVQDQSGAVVPGVAVTLLTDAGTVVQSTTTDGSGAFRFERVAAGPYALRATFEGFKPASSRLRVSTRSPGSQKLVLFVADINQDITVSNGASQVDTSASNNVDAIGVDQAMLEKLPVFDQDYVGTIARFLDAGSSGTGGVTLVVNGMEVSALRVSASAVQQIKINQDPYSAEYSRPGRGRIDILTKPGGQAFQGELNLIGRDAQLDARNAFAPTKPPERKHIMEGVFGGPLGHGDKTSFLISASDQQDDQQALVFALGPFGTITDAVPQPNRQSLVSFNVTRQISDKTTISIRPSYEYESNSNRGVGGTTLASAATNFTHHEQQISYTQQSILRPTLVNQFQVLVGHEREPTTSVSSAPGLVVAGAFTGGGGQGDIVRTETHMQLTESLAWTKGRHVVQAGFQLPDWSRRGFEDHTSVGGTFYFSGLDTYAAGQPYAFIQQQGNGDLALLEKQVGVYLKDDWQLKPNVSLSFGVRYDWQNYFHDDNNVAPRMSFAYAPGDRKTNVIRGGVGVFNDRSGPVVIADVLHSQPGGLTRTVISNPTYPDPLQSGSATAQPPSIVQLAPNVQIPQTLQYSLGVDHQLRKTTTLSITYTGSQGYHLFRSRDINAPPPPLYLSRPDPAYGVVREVESDGRQTTDSLQVTVRGKMNRWFSGQTQYTWSRAYNDTNGIGAFPANDYDVSGEWARADFDRRHRFLLLGSLSAGGIADIGIGITMNSGAPYTETLGQDVFNNSRGRARPVGVARDSLTTAPYASLDLRVSREVTIGGKGKDARTLALALDAFNVLNRVNYTSYVGTLGSPFFGQPVRASAPRQVQLSARVQF